MLFDNVTKHSVSLSKTAADGKPPTVGYLVDYICENLIKDSRKELFILDGAVSVRKIFCCRLVTDTAFKVDQGSSY